MSSATRTHAPAALAARPSALGQRSGPRTCRGAGSLMVPTREHPRGAEEVIEKCH